jgi:hypothetical protein
VVKGGFMRDALLRFSSLHWLSILVVIYWVVFYFLNKKKKTALEPEPERSGFQISPEVAGFSRLVAATLGDRATAQRLVDYESRRSPGISRAEAIQRAFDSLKDDRSRL